MDLEPRLLRYFLAVAQELHFGRQGAPLHLSSYAEHQIRNLERILGTDLSAQSSSVALTPPAGHSSKRALALRRWSSAESAGSPAPASPT